MTRGRFARLLLVLGVAGITPAAAVAQDDFYRGKTIRIVVGFSAGGGFDTFARTFARHLGRQLPGAPTVIVENMPGAGSLIAANHVYKVARPDGLTIGHFIGGLFLGQVLGQKGIEFDARKFEFLGAPANDHVVCVMAKASGITTLEKWMTAPAPVKMGGVAPGSSTPDNATRAIKAALGLPIQLVTGYKGTADIRLAVEAGELAGTCFNWGSIRATWRKALDAGELVVLLQLAPKSHPELPGVPLAIDLAKTDEARRVIEVAIHADSAVVRSLALPPGTPRDRVQLLRRAFAATLRDKEFLAEAERAKLEIEPIPGDELERVVERLFKLEPPMIARLKTILYD
jgi:tripartite-type tricarboxylate transporter receptor subunit TctC